MNSNIKLNYIHHQRLRGAVQAAQAGAQIKFRVNEGEPATIVWSDAAKPREQHAVLNLYGQRQAWLCAVEAAFQAELAGQ